MEKEILTDSSLKSIQERIDNDKNIESIYGMLHRFREWNRDWDTLMKNKPSSVDLFVQQLSSQYSVTPKMQTN